MKLFLIEQKGLAYLTLRPKPRDLSEIQRKQPCTTTAVSWHVKLQPTGTWWIMQHVSSYR